MKKIKFTTKFPTKEGIYLCLPKDEQYPQLTQIFFEDEDNEEIAIIPLGFTYIDHNESFCISKNNKDIKFYGPITFSK